MRDFNFDLERLDNAIKSGHVVIPSDMTDEEVHEFIIKRAEEISEMEEGYRGISEEDWFLDERKGV